MIKIISRLAVVAGFLLAFPGCHLIQKNQAESESSPSHVKRPVAGVFKSIIKTFRGGRDLRGRDFSGKNVIEEDFSGDDLRGAIFKAADAAGTNFRMANLSDADMRWADFTEADFRGAILERAKLNIANLEGTNFQGAIMIDVDLTRVTLFEGASFKDAVMTGAKMSDELREYARAQGAIVDI